METSFPAESLVASTRIFNDDDDEEEDTVMEDPHVGAVISSPSRPIVSPSHCLQTVAAINPVRRFNVLLRTRTHTHTQSFYCSLDFVRNNPGEPVPEETFTHSHLA